MNAPKVQEAKLVEVLRTACHHLYEQLNKYVDREDMAFIARAYQFSDWAHRLQKRHSGELFIMHPVSVATMLAKLHFDRISIASALLHDVVEDTEVEIGDISENFGDQVAYIVEGLSKLNELKIRSKIHKQALNYQKFIVATAKDFRIIVVKLCDRLHNMQTLCHLQKDRQIAIAQETMNIYVPLGMRIGMRDICNELEELSFATIHPWRYHILRKALANLKKKSHVILTKLLKSAEEHVKRSGISFVLSSREKRLGQIFAKMRDKRVPFANVMDIFAMRLLVNNIDDCYRMLGVVHEFLPPIPGKIKDYIAIPKENGYQSLHTVLSGPQNTRIEVQIRTHEMEQVAEFGIASHALYKANKTSSQEERSFDRVLCARNWLASLGDQNRTVVETLEFTKSLRAEFLSHEVYVFTPSGEIKALPANASSLDFAFSLHTEIGLRAVSCKVDFQARPINHRLKTGQTVHIISREEPFAEPERLGYVVTSKARHFIRNFLKTLPRERAIAIGTDIFQRVLKKYKLELKELEQDILIKLAEVLQKKNHEMLLFEMGLGNIDSGIVSARIHDLIVPTSDALRIKVDDTHCAVRGNIDLPVCYARCCDPVRGDEIIGIQTAGKGLVVHRSQCANTYSRGKRNISVAIEWSGHISEKEEYICAIMVEVLHRTGVLAGISRVIADRGSNIEKLDLSRKTLDKVVITFWIGVKNQSHLDSICRKIAKAVPDSRVKRVCSGIDGIRHKTDMGR